MDVRFCEGRDHSREAPMRAEDLDREVRALTSAPGHVCFFLDRRLTWMSVSRTSVGHRRFLFHRVHLVCENTDGRECRSERDLAANVFHAATCQALTSNRAKK